MITYFPCFFFLFFLRIFAIRNENKQKKTKKLKKAKTLLGYKVCLIKVTKKWYKKVQCVIGYFLFSFFQLLYSYHLAMVNISLFFLLFCSLFFCVCLFCFFCKFCIWQTKKKKTKKQRLSKLQYIGSTYTFMGI